MTTKSEAPGTPGGSMCIDKASAYDRNSGPREDIVTITRKMAEENGSQWGPEYLRELSEMVGDRERLLLQQAAADLDALEGRLNLRCPECGTIVPISIRGGGDWRTRFAACECGAQVSVDSISIEWIGNDDCGSYIKGSCHGRYDTLMVEVNW